MDDAETAEVLALVAALDPWSLEVDDMLVDAWTLAMPDVDGNLAKRAVIAHYRLSGKRISIADVISGAAEIERQDRARIRAGELRTRRETDRAALPPAKPTRDRTADIARLLAEHRNWSPIGDLAMRRRQANEHPALEAAYRRALREKAQEQADEQPAE